ncbi:MAG: methionyl-tRNA formyltransferase [Clostridia bacterium]|nr:methionyl-tRNA formyltransferase [Clostridia bacterium]
MNILFMGTPDFAVPCLKALIESSYNVCSVVTQPDKPAGRGHRLTPPPVKVLAEEHDIPVFQPETLKDFAFKEQLEKLNPELIIVVAYGKILPEYILDFPKHGCINMHASLLPKYRGAGPIQWSVLNGEEKTGVTSMLMEKGLDTGDMLLKSETTIGEYETASELHDRLMVMGADLLIETIDALKNGTLKPEKQVDSLSCYAPMISKEMARIDWSKPAREVINLICGMNSWPVAHTNYLGEFMKVYRAVLGNTAKGEFGKIVSANSKGLEVICGDGKTIIIDEIQFKGSKAMQVKDYLNGHEIKVGEILG